MKSIPLTQGKVAIVDDEDYPELSKHKWHAVKNGNTYYASRQSPRNPATYKQTPVRMHVIISGTPKGMDTDHINGDGLDNRRENLRIVTHRQNGQNRHQEKSSKFPGINWEKRRRKWRARIKINGKERYLGSYDNEWDAHQKYLWACDWLEHDGLIDPCPGV